MRLLSAAAVGALTALFVVTPAVAAPSLEIKLDAKYSTSAVVQPKVVVTNATSGGTLQYRRYSNSSCGGSGQFIQSVSIPGNGEYTGPNLQTGNPGEYSLRVYFGSTNKCQSFLLQRPTTLTTQLTRSIFQVGDKIEPQIALQGTTGDAGGQIGVARWTTGGCGPAIASSAGIRPIVNGQVQTPVNLQESTIGVRSFRVTYSGDTKNSEAAAACKDYTVGTYIRGKVFLDMDGSGLQEAEELGFAGVVITLQKGQNTATATTNTNGAYEFLVTSPGLYTVLQVKPAGYDNTTADRLTVTVTAAGNMPAGLNFGVAQVPSTLLPTLPPTSVEVDSSTGAALTSASQSGFAALRLIALGLVVIAALTLLVLVFAARWRRDEQGF